MARLRPKLSQAQKRELEVRKQLGISPTDPRARGRLGAARAEAELARRKKLARQRRPGWDSLCFELQDMVLKNLSIADLQNVRLSGLGSGSIAGRQRLRDTMRRRCRDVYPLWKMWNKGTSKYQPSDSRYDHKPTDFTSLEQRLVLSPSEEGLPASISEMRALRFLDISRLQSSVLMSSPPPLKTLPKSLGACQRLLEMRMSHHHFEYIPDCILQLRNLRRLEIEYNVHLKCIPDDIGVRLQNLTFLNIRECVKVNTLPDSLLARLEAGIAAKPRHRIPLLLTSRCFKGDYLKDTIVPEKYPTLAYYLRNGKLTGPNFADNNWPFLDGGFGMGFIDDF